MQRPDHFPHLHVRPAQGWVNDPNGVGHWDGRWHVMYQWNPSAPEHTDIHWGHMSSPDLLRWRDDGVALRPRSGEIDAAGVWSGVAVADEDDVALVYTAVPDEARNACVAVARRRAGGTWVQPDRAATEHPDRDRWIDVRDPFIVSIAVRRFGIMGAGLAGGDPADGPVPARGGAVLVYDAADLDDWRLLGPLVSAGDLPDHLTGSGAIWECPQLVAVGDLWLLVVSWDAGVGPEDPAHVGGLVRRQGVTCYVGDVDMSGPVPRFTAMTETRLDHGPDFYAPQLIVDRDRVLAWGWSWEGRGTGTNRRSDADIAASGWAGTLTFPREVTIDEAGRVMCRPARELDDLLGEALDVRHVGGKSEMRTSAPAWSLAATGEVHLDLVDASTGKVRTVWTGNTSGPVSVFVDGSIVEVFDSTGSTTRRAYPGFGEIWRVRSTGSADAAMLSVSEKC